MIMMVLCALYFSNRIELMDSCGLANPPGSRDPLKMAETATRLVRDMSSGEGMLGQNPNSFNYLVA